ncbi:MAG: type II toxin-antitoxin system VapC family toxin [Chloroflexi bacterium]|nr:type II toxin-antitoxin system VapC family toxin [Chloroflexota bacterium]
MTSPELVMLDSNIPMYAAGQEHSYRDSCQRVLERIVAGELEAVTNVEVHQEILHRYIALGLAAKGREVSQDFQYLVPRVLPVSLEEIELARDLSARYPELPARDLIHLSVMLNHGIEVVVSADRHFDRFSEIHRLDPSLVV